MAEQIIEVEGESLEAARAGVQAQLPEGYQVIAEVIEEGKRGSNKATGDTLDAAFAVAEAGVPAGSAVTGKKELLTPDHKTITVEAEDEAAATKEAVARATSTYQRHFRVGTPTLSKPGRKGMLGIGHQPNQYTLEIRRLAEVEVLYQQKTRIKATIDRGTLFETTEFNIWLPEGFVGGNPRTDEAHLLAALKAANPSIGAQVDNMVKEAATVFQFWAFDASGGDQNWTELGIGKQEIGYQVMPGMLETIANALAVEWKTAAPTTVGHPHHRVMRLQLRGAHYGVVTDQAIYMMGWKDAVWNISFGAPVSTFKERQATFERIVGTLRFK